MKKQSLYPIKWVEIKSAIVSGIYATVLAVLAYVIGHGDVFSLDWKELTNFGILAGFTTCVSLLKSFTTTTEGKVLGITQIK